MAIKIGFMAEDNCESRNDDAVRIVTEQTTPRRSVVQVYFEKRNMNLAYYNDRFDLRRGDLVYVDGKLEGMRGIVTDVSYNFKIKISDYKRVIAVVDTSVKGRVLYGGQSLCDI